MEGGGGGLGLELGVGVVYGLVKEKKGGRLEDGWRMEDGKGFGLRIKKKELTTC